MGDQWETYIPLPSDVGVNQMATILMKSRERGAINFSILAPVNEFLPVLKLNKAVQASLKEIHSYNFQYPLVEGHGRLLKQISIRTMRWKNTVGQDHILITHNVTSFTIFAPNFFNFIGYHMIIPKLGTLEAIKFTDKMNLQFETN